MSNFDESSEIQLYWNEEGGSKWVDNIDFVESMLEPLSNSLFEHIAATGGESVLDVGCGGAVTSIRLAEQVGSNGSVLGVDVSAPILSVARSRAADISNLEVQHGDAATASLGDNRFDIITSRFGVMFFDDPVLAFSNLHGSLKTSGRLVFMCWRTLEENPWMSEPAAAAFEILAPPEEKPDPEAPGPFSLADAGRLENILGSAGFNNIDLRSADMELPMGDLDTAVSFLLKMGPAAEVIREATAAERTEVAAEIRAVMEKYSTDEGIFTPAASWIVSASK